LIHPAPRKYGLCYFNIEYRVFGLSIVRLWRYGIELIEKVFCINLPHPFVISDNNVKSYSELMTLAKTKKLIILRGYWASELYFKHNRDKICHDLQISVPLRKDNQTWYDLIKQANSVCLHVRRGDYLTKEHIEIYGNCATYSYYMRAIGYINANVIDPVFFIFSDDIQWAKNTFHLNYPTHFMDQNSSEMYYEDFHLMMKCKHFIIANSTFSWWAAWLSNESKNKIVISPSKWNNNGDIDNRLIPDTWIKINV